MLYVLAGQFEHAGVLGDIVVRSDRRRSPMSLAAIQTELWQHRVTLFSVSSSMGCATVKNELKLNQPDASDGWITADAIWLVSKTVSDRLRAHLLSQGIEGVPDRNSTLFNVFQDNGLIVANPAGKAIWDAEILSPTGWKNAFTFLEFHLHSYGQLAKTARSLWRLGASPQRRSSPCRSFRSAGGKAQPYCRGRRCRCGRASRDEPASDHGPQPDEVDDTDYLLDLMDMRDAPTIRYPPRRCRRRPRSKLSHCRDRYHRWPDRRHARSPFHALAKSGCRNPQDHYQ